MPYSQFVRKSNNHGIGLIFGLLALVAALPAAAQEVTLRLQHFLPADSGPQVRFLKPWADDIARASKGRVKVEIYPGMVLGGTPAQLYDQVKDGTVDLAWTVPSYTPDRFPRAEVFELPFIAGSATATSQAAQAFYEKHLKAEFADVHVLLMHVHTPGSFFTREKAVRSLADLKGLRIRTPTHLTTESLKALGALPVAMPAPELPRALSAGSVDGAVIPFELSLSLKAHETARHVTEVAGSRGFYTTVFLFAMNKAKYDALPSDLKAVIDARSGRHLARKAGRLWDVAEKPGRDAALAAKVAFHKLPAAEVTRMRQATRPVIDAWIDDMASRGIDGKALIEDARTLVGRYAR